MFAFCVKVRLTSRVKYTVTSLTTTTAIYCIIWGEQSSSETGKCILCMPSIIYGWNQCYSRSPQNDERRRTPYRLQTEQMSVCMCENVRRIEKQVVIILSLPH